MPSEARRAVWHALPMLRLADEVFVGAIIKDPQRAAAVEVCECHPSRRQGQEPISGFAAKQRRGRVAPAEHVDADLIASGADGYIRLREWVFGGVTRDLLDHSPVACFMAH
jgi:nucleotide-binding universal stress UspA family protein